MSQLELRSANDSKTKRKVHHSLRIDMTPMVDLGFLLISFFIFTTTLTEKNTMNLIVPVDGGIDTPIPESKTLSFILANDDKVYAYEGIWETAVDRKNIRLTNYSADGIRNMILSKQKSSEKSMLPSSFLGGLSKGSVLTRNISPAPSASLAVTIGVCR